MLKALYTVRCNLRVGGKETADLRHVLLAAPTPGDPLLCLRSRFASRVDVEVLASDDTKSAVSGALESYSYVITTSTKPVEAGKQVRLANN